MSKNVAAIGVAAALVAVYVFLVSPLDAKRNEIQERLQAEYTTLSKYQKILSDKEQIEPRLERTRAELHQMEGNIFENTEISVAFAKLQNNVQGLASKSGLSVTSIKPLPTISYKHYTGLPLYVDCKGNIRELGKFLKEIDSSGTFYGIDRLDISVAQGNGLRIRMQLSGLMSSA
ncbi:MAG: type II secretion system protein GspM [Nitrospirota bacterium]|jgi:Tfp pilus assembly protein PilO